MRDTHSLLKPGYFVFVVVLVVTAPGLSYSSLHYAQAQDGENGPTVCAANEVHIRGQEWEIDGTIVGGVQDSLPAGEDAVDYDMLAQQFGNMTLGGSPPLIDPDQPVVLLIVDDFETRVKLLSHGEYVYQTARQMVEAVTVFGIPTDMVELRTAHINYADAAGIQGVIEETLDDVDHGRVVLNMSFALIPCFYPLDVEQFQLEEPYALSWQEFVIRGDYSLFQYVESTLGEILGQLSDEEVQSLLDEKLQFLLGGEPEVQLLNDEVDIRAYLAEVILYDWLSTFTRPSPAGEENEELDTLLTFLWNISTELDSDDKIKVVPVAAAGNYGSLPYPIDLNGDGTADTLDANGDGMADTFAPASLFNVISVSSTKVDYYADPGSVFTQLSKFTNAGGIKAPGEWHYIAESDEYVAGTSFAAPIASVLVALSQATSVNRCEFDLLEQDNISNTYFVDAVLNVCTRP